MKRIIILFLLCVNNFLAFGQTSFDSLQNSAIEEIKKSMSEVKETIEGINNNTPNDSIPQNETKKCIDCVVSTFEHWLLILPFITGILIIVYIIYRLKSKNYSLAVALSYNPYLSSSSSLDKLKEVDPTKLYLYNHPSSTRLIAFLSSLVTIIIAFSLTIYSSYLILCGKQIPDFNNLISVFVALGMGVVPYGINRITAKEKKASLTDPTLDLLSTPLMTTPTMPGSSQPVL